MAVKKSVRPKKKDRKNIEFGEAPVNGGRNYNGPKVAKFLVR